MKHELGNKIKELRIKSNLTQNELAEKLNITQASLSSYETGTKKPTLETLMKICSFFSRIYIHIYITQCASEQSL